jgi:hypothetical protein
MRFMHDPDRFIFAGIPRTEEECEEGLNVDLLMNASAYVTLLAVYLWRGESSIYSALGQMITPLLYLKEIGDDLHKLLVHFPHVLPSIGFKEFWITKGIPTLLLDLWGDYMIDEITGLGGGILASNQSGESFNIDIQGTIKHMVRPGSNTTQCAMSLFLLFGLGGLISCPKKPAECLPEDARKRRHGSKLPQPPANYDRTHAESGGDKVLCTCCCRPSPTGGFRTCKPPPPKEGLDKEILHFSETMCDMCCNVYELLCMLRSGKYVGKYDLLYTIPTKVKKTSDSEYYIFHVKDKNEDKEEEEEELNDDDANDTIKGKYMMGGGGEEGEKEKGLLPLDLLNYVNDEYLFGSATQLNKEDEEEQEEQDET